MHQSVHSRGPKADQGDLDRALVLASKIPPLSPLILLSECSPYAYGKRLTSTILGSQVKVRCSVPTSLETG